jgi:3-oxoacyl-(acyl-carrier-protein) synthase
VGVIALRRLADAERRGDRILALIRGSAINQDGRSGGLTAPNGPAQQAVIAAALTDAGLSPPISTTSRRTALAHPRRSDRVAGSRCGARNWPGRVTSRCCRFRKTNFGHLEAASGVAGLLKVVVALQQRHVPPPS